MINLGVRLKELRLQKGFTMRELARRAGCSASFLSQLELNRASPTLVNLEKICGALKMPVVDVLREEPPLREPIRVSLAADRSPVAMLWHRVRMRHLLPPDAPNSFTALQLMMEPGGETPFRSSKRSMKQLAVVLAGRVEFAINDQQFTLGAEEAIYFDLRHRHQWRNTSEEPADILFVHPYVFSLFEQEEEDLIWSRRKEPVAH